MSAQSANVTVKGTVQTSNAGWVRATVSLKDPRSNEDMRSTVVQNDKYRIENVVRGQYKVVTCAGDQYKADPQIVRVDNDTTVDFILKGTSFRCFPLPDSSGNNYQGLEGLKVSLVERKTGCRLPDTYTYAYGLIRIPGRLQDYEWRIIDGTPRESEHPCPRHDP